MISRNIIDFDDITLDEWKELYKLATSIISVLSFQQ